MLTTVTAIATALTETARSLWDSFLCRVALVAMAIGAAPAALLYVLA